MTPRAPARKGSFCPSLWAGPAGAAAPRARQRPGGPRPLRAGRGVVSGASWVARRQQPSRGSPRQRDRGAWAHGVLRPRVLVTSVPYARLRCNGLPHLAWTLRALKDVGAVVQVSCARRDRGQASGSRPPGCRPRRTAVRPHTRLAEGPTASVPSLPAGPIVLHSWEPRIRQRPPPRRWRVGEGSQTGVGLLAWRVRRRPPCPRVSHTLRRPR